MPPSTGREIRPGCNLGFSPLQESPHPVPGGRGPAHLTPPGTGSAPRRDGRARLCALERGAPACRLRARRRPARRKDPPVRRGRLRSRLRAPGRSRPGRVLPLLRTRGVAAGRVNADMLRRTEPAPLTAAALGTHDRPVLLVLAPRGLGGVVCGVPAYRALARAFPHRRRVAVVPR